MRLVITKHLFISFPFPSAAHLQDITSPIHIYFCKKIIVHCPPNQLSFRTLQYFSHCRRIKLSKIFPFIRPEFCLCLPPDFLCVNHSLYPKQVTLSFGCINPQVHKKGMDKHFLFNHSFNKLCIQFLLLRLYSASIISWMQSFLAYTIRLFPLVSSTFQKTIQVFRLNHHLFLGILNSVNL